MTVYNKLLKHDKRIMVGNEILENILKIFVTAT